MLGSSVLAGGVLMRRGLPADAGALAGVADFGNCVVGAGWNDAEQGGFFASCLAAGILAACMEDA